MTTTTKSETTLVEQVRFSIDFMVLMLRVDRYREAEQAVQRIHVLLDEMEAEDAIARQF